MENAIKKIKLRLSNGEVHVYGFASEESRENYLEQLYSKERFCKTIYDGKIVSINKDHIISIEVF